VNELAAKQALLLDAVNRIILAHCSANRRIRRYLHLRSLSSQPFPRQAIIDLPSTARDCLQARERARKEIGCSNSTLRDPNKRIAWMLQQQKLMLSMPR
jgi:hypothetical protein